MRLRPRHRALPSTRRGRKKVPIRAKKPASVDVDVDVDFDVGLLRGASQAAVDAVAGITNIVEELHHQIAKVVGSPAGVVKGVNPGIRAAFRQDLFFDGGASPTTDVPTARTKGIPGFVYRRVHGVTKLVGSGLDAAFATFQHYQQHQQRAQLIARSVANSAAKSAKKSEAANSASPSNGVESARAALNGVFGDYLAATHNPLAISMSLCFQGQPMVLDKRAIKKILTNPAVKSNTKPIISGKLVVLVHGLCMNDLQWHRDGHDHGALLARDFGFTPLYLRYNSGRHVATNGGEFAALLEQLVEQWPAPITELAIIGHSMGGLVSRSACEAGGRAEHTWPRHLKKMIFLGTPHHGAPLERAGHWVDILLGMTPFSAPFAKLSKVRSAGIQDLRYGNVVGSVTGARSGKISNTNNNADTYANHDSNRSPKRHVMPLALPKGVKCYLIAATKKAKALTPAGHIPGDGLVPVNSALGLHQDAALALNVPATRRKICYGMGHFDLLSSQDVYKYIYAWLAK